MMSVLSCSYVQILLLSVCMDAVACDARSVDANFCVRKTDGYANPEDEITRSD